MIVCAGDVTRTDQDLLTDPVQRVTRDISIFGANPKDYRTVESLGLMVRDLFHRKPASIIVPSWAVLDIVAQGPIVGPTDDDTTVHRLVHPDRAPLELNPPIIAGDHHGEETTRSPALSCPSARRPTLILATRRRQSPPLRADAYTKIGGTETISDFGDTATDVTFTGVEDSRTEHLKGSTDGGSLEITCADDTTDPGQILVKAASAPTDQNEYNIKLEYQNGDVGYIKGPIMGFSRVNGDRPEQRGQAQVHHRQQPWRNPRSGVIAPVGFSQSIPGAS